LQGYAHLCSDATCTGAGSAVADSAATALGLLPFLAAGQTHRQKGPYAKQIYSGLAWLTAHQKPDGDLSAGSTHRMYSHGLATIALAEAAGMTREAQSGFQERVKEWVGGMDFVSREEFEAVKAMAAAARDENEALAARIAALEAAAGSAAKVSTAKAKAPKGG
jgi:BMFP domain-containing protein YqiC